MSLQQQPKIKELMTLETAILEIVQSGKVQAADMDLAINQRQAAALTQAKISLEQVQATIAEQTTT